MQPEEQPLQIRFLKDDFQPPLGRRDKCVATVLSVSIKAVPIQQHDLPSEKPPAGMSGDPTTGLFDD